MRRTVTIPSDSYYRWTVGAKTNKGWPIQPARRTRMGTEYGPAVMWLETKNKARAAIRAIACAPEHRDFRKDATP